MPDWKNAHASVCTVKIKNVCKGRKLAQKIIVGELNSLWNACCSRSKNDGCNFILIYSFADLLVKNSRMFISPQLSHFQNLIKAVKLYTAKLIFIKCLVLCVDYDYIFQSWNFRKTFTELSKNKRIFNAYSFTFGKA